MQLFKSCTDELGRILIPGELRQKHNLKESDTVSLYSVDKNTILLQLESETAPANEKVGLDRVISM